MPAAKKNDSGTNGSGGNGSPAGPAITPSFLLWEGLPGFDRLQRILAVAEEAAFVPEGMVRWLNSIRPEGAPRSFRSPVLTTTRLLGLAESVTELGRRQGDGPDIPRAV
jgi:hypothetical protein